MIISVTLTVVDLWITGHCRNFPGCNYFVIVNSFASKHMVNHHISRFVMHYALLLYRLEQLAYIGIVCHLRLIGPVVSNCNSVTFWIFGDFLYNDLFPGGRGGYLISLVVLHGDLRTLDIGQSYRISCVWYCLQVFFGLGYKVFSFMCQVLKVRLQWDNLSGTYWRLIIAWLFTN